MVSALALALFGMGAIVLGLTQQGPSGTLGISAVPAGTAQTSGTTGGQSQSPTTPGAKRTATVSQPSGATATPYGTPSVNYTISSIELTVSPSSFACGSQVETFTFTATVMTTPTSAGFPLTGDFGGNGPQGPIGWTSGRRFSTYMVAPHATVTKETYNLSLGANDPDGRYSLQFFVSTPGGGMMYSNAAVVSKTC